MARTWEATDRMIAGLRERGIEVVDQRGKLPINPSPALRYGLVARELAGVRHLVVHWTGDAFDSGFFGALGLPDAGGDGKIDGSLTAAQETKLLRWYANFHVGRDGGTWGGLAYGALAFPSGRVHVAWDLGTLTYHAFNANGSSYALCCPLSRGAEPTAAQYRALRALIDQIALRTPEVTAGPANVLGHNEAHVIDERNRGTQCPGTVLPFVRAYRAGADLSRWTGSAAPPPPVADAADRDLDAFAAFHELGAALGSGRLRRDYGGRRLDGKAALYFDPLKGLTVVLRTAPGEVEDVTRFALDDLINGWQAAGVFDKYGSW